MCAGLLLAILLCCACRKDSKQELKSWMNSACSCVDRSCATRQRQAFWKLVQEFHDDAPSQERARDLNHLVNRGQACLEKLSVDIYALN